MKNCLCHDDIIDQNTRLKYFNDRPTINAFTMHFYYAQIGESQYSKVIGQMLQDAMNSGLD